MKISTQPSFSRAVVLVATALLCTGPVQLQAEEALSTVAQRLDETAEPQGETKAAAGIGAKFTSLAGSPENATALVTGLRNGTAITLTTTVDGQVTTTEIQPATGKLGYGNTFISLALAQESLTKAGITEPTPAQLMAALNGGTVTGSDGATVTLPGVLALRAAGNGWGDIAHTLGIKLGPVISGLHAANQRVETMERPEVSVRPDKAAHGPEFAGRPVSAGRPVWAGTAGAGPKPNLPPGHMVRPGKP